MYSLSSLSRRVEYAGLGTDCQEDVSVVPHAVGCAEPWWRYGQPNEFREVDRGRGREAKRGVHLRGEGVCIWQEREVVGRRAILHREMLRIVID
jgi:hypothetical protein